MEVGRSSSVHPVERFAGLDVAHDTGAASSIGQAPPTRVELYTAVSNFTLRANTGEAAQVLIEMDQIVQQARAIGANRIVHRALYISAFCNLMVGQLNDCVDTCHLLNAELSDSPIDRGWRSSSESMLAIVSISRGERVRALDQIVEATILLRDGPTRGPGYLAAVNGVVIGCLSLRLYELALEEYARVEDDAVLAEYRVAAFFGILNTQLAHIYCGLELDRVGWATARSQFEQALEHGRRARTRLPEHDEGPWELILEARGGMCLAFLGETDLALPRLEAALVLLRQRPMEETIMARVGLARAASIVDRTVAREHADHALAAVGHLTDYALSAAASWERARVDLDTPGSGAALDYCRLIARESWDERARMVRLVSARVADEVRVRRSVQHGRLLHDEATGLPNRMLLLQQLSTYVAAGGELSLAFLDLSASPSDQTLHAIIATLDVDLLARYGPGELAAVGVGVSALEMADRIRAACGAGALDHLAVGIAALVAPASVSSLVAHADEALLTAQRRGGIWVNPCSSTC